MSSDAEALVPLGTPLEGIRRTIARRMAKAWEIPVFHLSITVDMQSILERRAGVPGASVTDMLLRDCATTLALHPALNAHFVDDSIFEFDRQNVAFAVATERGVLVPVIQDAGSLSDSELVQERKRLLAVARGNVLTPTDFANGTFTLSNLGMYGIDNFDAILNAPQVAILAVGAGRSVLALEAGVLVERTVATLTLTCDHRATDGATAAEFLQGLRRCIERGALLPAAEA
jgi:pyruvate dehydrogenase E2 component (dihydrolipoamide acetyltransferase)